LADDGVLEVGVVKSGGVVALARVLMRVAHGHPERSPFTEMTRGREIDITLDRMTPYQVDGGARKARHRLRATIEPLAITVCVPWETQP
jgi:diacylglycerol kinase (ATP)